MRFFERGGLQRKLTIGGGAGEAIQPFQDSGIHILAGLFTDDQIVVAVIRVIGINPPKEAKLFGHAADLAVKDGGIIILATPCPEGVSVTHQGMLGFTSQQADQIRQAIDQGDIQDQVSGALALAWARIRQRAEVYLVSGGISKKETRALGFTPFEDLQSALEAAQDKHGPEATVNVLTHAPETLPILSSE